MLCAWRIFDGLRKAATPRRFYAQPACVPCFLAQGTHAWPLQAVAAFHARKGGEHHVCWLLGRERGGGGSVPQLAWGVHMPCPHAGTCSERFCLCSEPRAAPHPPQREGAAHHGLHGPWHGRTGVVYQARMHACMHALLWPCRPCMHADALYIPSSCAVTTVRSRVSMPLLLRSSLWLRPCNSNLHGCALTSTNALLRRTPLVILLLTLWEGGRGAHASSFETCQPQLYICWITGEGGGGHRHHGMAWHVGYYGHRA